MEPPWGHSSQRLAAAATCWGWAVGSEPNCPHQTHSSAAGTGSRVLHLGLCMHRWCQSKGPHAGGVSTRLGAAAKARTD